MKYYLIFVFILFSPIVKSQQSMQVLFVGNSLTFYHDMPQMVQAMLDEKGNKIKIQQSTHPGKSLCDHLTRINGYRAERGEIPTTVQKLLSQNWDYVVLQEGTVRAIIPESKKYCFEMSVLQFDSIIKMKHGKTVLYQGYATNQYPINYCYKKIDIQAHSPNELKVENELTEKDYCTDIFYNSSQQFKVIKDAYSATASKINAGIVPIGQIFEVFKIEYPTIDLYENDQDDHPSKHGAYLIACMFYRYFTSDKVSGIKYTAGINADDVHKIQTIVDALYH